VAVSMHTLVGGQVLSGVHSSEQCAGRPCCIHNPSDHPMRGWKQLFYAGMMFRISDDDGLYPDPDDPKADRTPNAIRCLSCDDIIVSLHVHDYVTCSCGNVSVDGGMQYHKRAWRGGDPRVADLPPRKQRIVADVRCAHRYERFLPWPIKLRYRCVLCGDVSRLYDSIDARMTRPVHPHMTVVVRGFNTVSPASSSANQP
jgi:hypothetical protein